MLGALGASKPPSGLIDLSKSNKLTYGGNFKFCGAKGGGEIFEIRLGDGTSVEHTWESLKEFHSVLADRYKKKKGLLPSKPKEGYKFGDFSKGVVKAHRENKKKKKMGISLEGQLHEKANMKADWVTSLLDSINASPELQQDNSVNRFFSSSSGVDLAQKGEILKVEVLAGRNLVSKDKNGFSDPFVRFRMYDDQKQGLGGHNKTYIVKKTLNPTWKDQMFAFDVGDFRCAGIALTVWDWDRASSDDFMGMLRIPIDTIPHNAMIDRWFPLRNTHEHSDEKVHGEIRLRMVYTTSSAVGSELTLNPGLTKLEQERIRVVEARQDLEEQENAALQEERNGGRLCLKYMYNPPIGRWEGYFTVQVCDIELSSAIKPYVVAQAADQKFETRIATHVVSQHAFYETFFFYVDDQYHKEYCEIDFTVFTRSKLKKSRRKKGKAIRFADCSILLTRLEANKEYEEWVQLWLPPPTQKTISKRLGADMAQDGWRPKYPIMLVPGFASSGLQIMEGAEDWIGDRVWLEVGKVASCAGKSKIRMKQDKFKKILKEEKEKALAVDGWSEACALSIADIRWCTTMNRWLRHNCLDPVDGISDPPGIKVRSIPGNVSCTYLDPSVKALAPMSYIMGPLVETLEALGYNETNLQCAPYDWRIPPSVLEQRDGFYSWLKDEVEAMSKRNGQPVILTGHSMGNRTCQYFLNFVNNQPGGREWIDTYIHTFVAVGAPFLGAPKTLRALATGDGQGLETFITWKEAVAMGRAISITGMLTPLLDDQYPDDGVGDTFLYETDDDGNITPMKDWAEYLTYIGADIPIQWIDQYYTRDPNYGGGDAPQEEWPMVTPPPVNRLYALYGINLDTELKYLVKKGKAGISQRKLDTHWKPTGDQFNSYNFSMGRIYETPDTPQKLRAHLTGKDARCSGDGTVPYASLAWCKQWEGKIPELIIEELEGVEHRAILNDKLFFQKFLEYVAASPEEESDSEEVQPAYIRRGDYSGLFDSSLDLEQKGKKQSLMQ